MKTSLKKLFTKKGVFDAAPSFEDDCHFYEHRRLWGEINCFSYALGYRDAGFPMLESILQSQTPKHVLTGLPEVIAHTNIKPIKDNKLQNIPEGHYPVAIFISHEEGNRLRIRDYHWYRMDDTGLWSHKQGTHRLEATNLDSRNRLIKNPLKAKRLSLSETYDYSVFVGFFAVPKGGARFFLERQDSYSGVLAHIKATLHQNNIEKKTETKRKERKSNKGISLSYEF